MVFKMPVHVRHVVVIVLMAGVISCLPLEAEVRHRRAKRDCEMCPPGSYMSSCERCSPCPSETYTNMNNTENSCLPCFKDCIAAFNMQEEKPCTTVSDVVCRCMDGFICTKTDEYTDQCLECVPEPPPAKQTIASQASSTQATSTQVPSTWTRSTQTSSTRKYLTQSSSITASSAVPQSQESHSKNVWIAIIVVMGILSSMITLCYLCRQSEIDCFKQWVKKCSLANQKEDNGTASSEISEPIKKNIAYETYQHAEESPSANSDCPTHQPTSTEQPLPTSGNLGPLHIYGASTVIVSLLNQFGLNCGDKEEECLQRQHAHEHEIHSPTSPTLPLSTEERNRDSGFISFPSQEQGKECHMSKEEGL